MRRLLTAAALLSLTTLVPEPAQTAPSFPVFLFGYVTNSPAPDADMTPWVWYVYADGTYDHGPSGYTYPSPTYDNGAGTWRWNSPTLTLNTPDEGYRGTFDGVCVNGEWVLKPFNGDIEGLFQACPIR